MHFKNDLAGILTASGVIALCVIAGTARASSINLDYSAAGQGDPTGSFYANSGAGAVALTDGVTIHNVDFGYFDTQPYSLANSLAFQFTRPLNLTVDGTTSLAFSQTLSGSANYDTAGSAGQYREVYLSFDGGDTVYNLGSYGTLDINLAPSYGVNDGLAPLNFAEIVGDVTYHSSLPAAPEPSPLTGFALGALTLGALTAGRRRSSRFDKLRLIKS